MGRAVWAAFWCAAVLPAAPAVSTKQIQAALRLSVAGDSARSLARALKEQAKSPLIEGREVAFVFESRSRPGPRLSGPIAAGKQLPMTRLGGSDIWVLVLEVSEDQMAGYQFVTAEGVLADPWNPERDPRGGSVLRMPKYRPPAESRLLPAPQRGEVKPLKLSSAVLESEQTGWLYIPKAYDAAKPACVLLVLDGSLYKDAHLPEILDSLVARKRIPVTIAVLLDPVRRSEEYETISDRYGRFLRDEVLARVGKEYALRTSASSRMTLGSDAGGLAAFSAAWHLPETFGRVLLQSASFVPMEKGNGARYPEWIRSVPAKPISGYLSVSRNAPESRSGSWVDGNHLVRGALRMKGYDFFYFEDEGYQDFATWEQQLPDALVRAWRGEQ